MPVEMDVEKGTWFKVGVSVQNTSDADKVVYVEVEGIENWEWLCGQLPTGKYRIGEEIMDFRRSENFDETIYYVEFEIAE